MEATFSIPMSSRRDCEFALSEFRKEIPKDRRSRFSWSWEEEVIPLQVGKVFVPVNDLRVILNDPDFGSWHIVSANLSDSVGECDHCKMLPKKHSMIFGVYHHDIPLNVGKECVNSLTGSISESWIDIYASFFRFLVQTKKRFNPENQENNCFLVSTNEFVSTAIHHFEKYPFCGSKSATPSWKDIRLFLKESFSKCDSHPKVNDVLQFWNGKDLRSEFDVKIHHALKSNMIHSSNFPILAYGVHHAISQLELKNEKSGFNQFLNEDVNQHIPFVRLKMISSKEFSSKFGKSFIIFLETEMGHSIKYFAKKDMIPFEGFKSFSCDLKKKEEYRGQNSTVVSNLKRIAEE